MKLPAVRYLAGLAIVAFAVGGTWKRAGTSEDVTGADYGSVPVSLRRERYGSWGAAYRNYVIRCMQDKG